MTKNIVFCADGTWNGPGEQDGDDTSSSASNVFKLFLKLAGSDMPGTLRLAKEQERSLAAADGAVEQVAKYLHGVGDSDNFLAKILGGALGAGLITRIVRGYTFISRNYASGDRIYLVGFSRGAYTARALAGLISAKGLLDPAKIDLSDKEAAYRLGSAVWYRYRREALASTAGPLGRLGAIVLDLPGFLQLPPVPIGLVPAPIEAVAVWDTVGALGIPIFDSHMVAIDVFQFANTVLSHNVNNGRQAISIDEQRASFTPTLWTPDPRIIQVLFPGAHADVGGGYTASNNECGLSDCALRWITGELAGLGVRFAGAPLIVEAPNPAGMAHQPWLNPPWLALPRAARNLPSGLALAQSVIDRIHAGPVPLDRGATPVPYTPTNIGPYLNGNSAAPGVTLMQI
jgi:T6SS, Phospholipase effector Tle1-like, catalytic domain